MEILTSGAMGESVATIKHFHEWLFWISGYSGGYRKSNVTPSNPKEESHCPAVFWWELRYFYSLVKHINATYTNSSKLLVTTGPFPQNTINNVWIISGLIGCFGRSPTDGHLLETLETTEDGSGSSRSEHRKEQDVPPSNDHFNLNCYGFSNWLAPFFNIYSGFSLV